MYVRPLDTAAASIDAVGLIVHKVLSWGRVAAQHQMPVDAVDLHRTTANGLDNCTAIY